MYSNGGLPNRDLHVDPKLTPGQVAALASLNRALAKCREAHLVLVGMENSLLAYNGHKFDKLRPELQDIYDIQLALGQGGDPEAKVQAADVYLESGGW
jgi:hypothetical protein